MISGWFFLKACFQGVGVIILPTEGIPMDSKQDYVAGRYTDMSPVDLFLSWNEPIADRIVGLGKLTRERIHVVGVPRFDFYRPPLADLSPAKAQTQAKYDLPREPNAPLILCATNFTTASLDDRQGFLRKDWKNLSFDKVEGFGQTDIDNLIRRERTSLIRPELC